MRTYTVKVHLQPDGSDLWHTTNAFEVVQNHEPGCHLVRYIKIGKTNEFHAWAAPIVIETNGIIGIDWSKAGERYSTNAAFTRAALEAPANLKYSGYTTTNKMIGISTNQTSWVTIKRNPWDTFNLGFMAAMIIALLVWVILSDTSPVWRRNRK